MGKIVEKCKIENSVESGLSVGEGQEYKFAFLHKKSLEVNKLISKRAYQWNERGEENGKKERKLLYEDFFLLHRFDLNHANMLPVGTK